MHVISINVGLPREVEWRDQIVRTSIYKKPVTGRVHVDRLNIEGDRQADLTVHGGVDKAIYVYPSEHYEPWQRELERVEMPWGMFGENLTTEGLTEDTVVIGEQWQVGQAVFTVVQPRQPCYKLALRFG